MRRDLDRLRRYAAALQCIAEDFRESAAGEAGRTAELDRFASVLDHMAASLMVPYTIASLEMARLPQIPAAMIQGEDPVKH